MDGRLSFGAVQWSVRLFIHFLTDSSNRSTSCLFSMMVSSRQEITFCYFSHQSSGPSLRRALCLPLITTCPSASDYFYFCFSSFTQLHLIPSLLISAQRLDPAAALVTCGGFFFFFFFHATDTSAADLWRKSLVL